MCNGLHKYSILYHLATPRKRVFSRLVKAACESFPIPHFQVLSDLLSSVYHSSQRICIDRCLKLIIVQVGINLRGVQRFVTQDFF